MEFKIPLKFAGIFEDLAKKEVTMFSPGAGEMGFLRRIEKEINIVRGKDSMIFVFDRKRKKGIAIRKNRLKIIKKPKHTKKHIIFKLYL